MKKLSVVIFALTMVWGWPGSAVLAGEKAPQKVMDLARTTLVKLGEDPVIVKAVMAENAKGKTLDQIKAVDQKWQATAGLDDTMKALMDSE